MPFTGSVEDRLAVRELYGSYSGAGFAGDREAWLLCWADDPVWDTPAGKGEGVAALTAGDRAKSRAYCREVSNWKDGRKVKIIGRYDDDLVRTPLGWRFQRRKFTMHIEE
jgi:SnoaL-like domain